MLGTERGRERERERDRERERERDGNVNCWLVKLQELSASDIVWGVEVYEGRTQDVMVVMVCWSSMCGGQDGGCNGCDGLLGLNV